MPKAPRGRRPAPNVKRRAPRPAPRPLGMAPNEPSANGGGTAAAVAARPQRPTTATWPAARRSAAPTAPRRRFSDSIADYAYVPADLRRIGLLAGGLVIFMVALSFVIR